jgi:tripartite-type tricarboxylate transporter receptor subunit TctC
VLKDPAKRERFRQLGLDILGNTPDEMAAGIKSEIAKWAKVIKEAKIAAN